jgi:hypothetical protein
MSQYSETKPDDPFDIFTENFGLGPHTTKAVFGLTALLLPTFIGLGVGEAISDNAIDALPYFCQAAATMGVATSIINYCMGKKVASTKSQPTSN